MNRKEFRYIRRSSLSPDSDIQTYPDLFSSEVEWLKDFAGSKFFKIPKNYKLNGHPKYLDGHVIGMDAASVATVWALQIDNNTQSVLDMCCAPGMKLMLIKDMLPPLATLVGTDVNENRLRVCRNLLKKYGYNDLMNSGIFLVDEDGNKKLFSKYVEETLPKKKRKKIAAKRQRTGESSPSVPSLFDRVLVDAECTHDGSERHESKHYGFWSNIGAEKNRVFYDTDEKVEILIENQKQSIVKGFQSLTPGGIMVYSTCSLQSRQNENVVQYLLDRFSESAELLVLPFKLVEDGGSVPAKRVFTDCCLFDPNQSGTSGQFIACVRKRA